MNAMPSVDWGAKAFDDAMWAAQFEPECLRQAMYELFVATSSMTADQREATDFISRGGGGEKWGSRMRRVESTKGRRDVTFRTQRKSGAKTEVHKLHWLDLYLYAWIEPNASFEFIVFAVKPLVASGLIDAAPRRWNRDGGSEWCWIDAYLLQKIPHCLLAGWKHPGEGVAFRWTTSKEWQENVA